VAAAHSCAIVPPLARLSQVLMADPQTPRNVLWVLSSAAGRPGSEERGGLQGARFRLLHASAGLERSQLGARRRPLGPRNHLRRPAEWRQGRAPAPATCFLSAMCARLTTGRATPPPAPPPPPSSPPLPMLYLGIRGPSCALDPRSAWVAAPL
jgi:hypothetical protein